MATTYNNVFTEDYDKLLAGLRRTNNDHGTEATHITVTKAATLNNNNAHITTTTTTKKQTTKPNVAPTGRFFEAEDDAQTIAKWNKNVEAMLAGLSLHDAPPLPSTSPVPSDTDSAKIDSSGPESGDEMAIPHLHRRIQPLPDAVLAHVILSPGTSQSNRTKLLQFYCPIIVFVCIIVTSLALIFIKM